jgi:hypothetical protein
MASQNPKLRQTPVATIATAMRGPAVSRPNIDPAARGGVCAAPIHGRSGGKSDRALTTRAARLAHIEIELDEHVVRVIEEDLPAELLGT